MWRGAGLKPHALTGKARGPVSNARMRPGQLGLEGGSPDSHLGQVLPFGRVGSPNGACWGLGGDESEPGDVISSGVANPIQGGKEGGVGLVAMGGNPPGREAA